MWPKKPAVAKCWLRDGVRDGSVSPLFLLLEMLVLQARVGCQKRDIPSLMGMSHIKSLSCLRSCGANAPLPTPGSGGPLGVPRLHVLKAILLI